MPRSTHKYGDSKNGNKRVSEECLCECVSEWGHCYRLSIVRDPVKLHGAMCLVAEPDASDLRMGIGAHNSRCQHALVD